MQPDELHKICTVMGTPTAQSWPEGLQLAAHMGFRFPQLSPQPLAKLVPMASPEAVELMSALCAWDPKRRPTAAQVGWGGGAGWGRAVQGRGSWLGGADVSIPSGCLQDSQQVGWGGNSVICM